MSAPLVVQVLALLISGQTADVALVPIARTNALSESRASELAAEVGDVLKEAGVLVTPGRPELPQALMVRDPRSAPREVVAYSGSLLDATMALRIEGGELGDRLVIALELLDSQSGASIATHTLQTLKGSGKSEWRAELKPILDAIFAVTAKRPAKPKVVEVVAEKKIEPPPEKKAEPPVVVEAPAPEPKSRGVYLATAGVGGGILGVSTVLFLMSRSKYDALANPAAPPLSEAEAQRTALEGQSMQSLAVAGFGVGALAVGVGLALYLWPEAQPEESAVSLFAGPGEVGVTGRF